MRSPEGQLVTVVHQLPPWHVANVVERAVWTAIEVLGGLLVAATWGWAAGVGAGVLISIAKNLTAEGLAIHFTEHIITAQQAPPDPGIHFT